MGNCRQTRPSLLSIIEAAPNLTWILNNKYKTSLSQLEKFKQNISTHFNTVVVIRQLRCEEKV